MLKNFFLKTIPLLLLVVLFNSCDKEFNVIGENLVGENSFDVLKSSDYSLIAYNKKIGPIQSNNLEINPLGIYDNPSFGTTTASFVTQVTLATVAPAIDVKTVKITSAVLTIPYFYDSTKTEVTTVGGVANTKYVLDSIYGPLNAKMKLSVYESGYFMPDVDPIEQLTQPQKFYTDQHTEFFAQKMPLLLNDASNKAENSEFFFDAAEHPVTTDGITTKTPPRMELNLNKEFFLEKVLKAAKDSLADNTAFKDHFKGLFFNVERIDGSSGNLAMVNFKAGKITIKYTETVDAKDVEKTLVLNLSGNTASLLTESNADAKYTSATASPNTTQGDANLYLKGGEGSMSILELFGPDNFGDNGISGASNGFPDELDIIRKNKYLINEANIVFHVNTAEMKTSYLPQRIYLYDFTNSKVLPDYSDASLGNNSKNSRYVFGGILAKESDEKGGGYYYKFRITNHVRSLVLAEKYTELKLGLVVTEDINKTAFYSLRDKTFVAPMASVMNPLGVIVFGNNVPSTEVANYNKRLKLEIYYTKPN